MGRESIAREREREHERASQHLEFKPCCGWLQCEHAIPSDAFALTWNNAAEFSLVRIMWGWGGKNIVNFCLKKYPHSRKTHKQNIDKMVYPSNSYSQRNFNLSTIPFGPVLSQLSLPPFPPYVLLSTGDFSAAKLSSERNEGCKLDFSLSRSTVRKQGRSFWVWDWQDWLQWDSHWMSFFLDKLYKEVFVLNTNLSNLCYQ